MILRRRYDVEIGETYSYQHDRLRSDDLAVRMMPLKRLLTVCEDEGGEVNVDINCIGYDINKQIKHKK
jgi:hypothetical protein